MFNTEILQAVVVAAIQSQGANNNITSIISETVDAMIDADRKLMAYEEELNRSTSEAQQRDSGTAN